MSGGAVHIPRPAMKWTRAACAFLFLAKVLALPQAYADVLPTPYPITDADRAFLASLKEALVAHDEKWVADRISMPIHVRIRGHRRLIKTRAYLIAHFNEIFSERIRKAVLEQNADDLFKTWQGAMVGRGEIWFETLLGPHGKSPPKTYIIGINN